MAKGRDANMDRTGALLEQQRRRALALGEALMIVDDTLRRLEEEYVTVLGFSVRVPARVGFDWLIIVRAEKPEGRVVAFVQGRSLFDVLESLLASAGDAQLRWQADQYAK